MHAPAYSGMNLAGTSAGSLCCHSEERSDVAI